MAYLGIEPRSGNFPVDYFTGNGDTVVFTLQTAPATSSAILVVIDGVTQSPNTYTVNGKTLTFSEAPPLTVANNVVVLHLGKQLDMGTPADGTISTAKILDQAITRSKLVNEVALTSVKRQTVLTGRVDANGQANFLDAASGLNVSVAASSAPLAVSFAAGFDDIGAVDYVKRITTDATNAFAGLAASSNVFMYIDRNAGAISYSHVKNLAPIYGDSYIKADGAGKSLLHFEGVDASTTITDENPNNTWTVTGNAQIDTAQFKFGTSSLLFDGTGDYITTTNTNWNVNRFEASCWFRLNAVGIEQSIVALGLGTGGYTGLWVSTSPTNKIKLYLSSNGASSWDIANGTLGTTTLVTGTWYRVRAIRTATAYKVYLSVNGAAETEEISVTSSTSVYYSSQIRMGMNPNAANSPMNGWVDEFKLVCPAETTAGTETPPITAFMGLPVNNEHWFDLSQYKMKYWNESLATWTEVQRVFVGEAVTDATSVTSVVTYALNGKYQSTETAIPALATRTAFNANLGVKNINEPVMYIKNSGAEQNYTAGMVFRPSAGGHANYVSTASVVVEDRNILSFTIGNSGGGLYLINRTTGASATIIPSKWLMFITADRGW
jgi:hypothetical protein